MASHRRSLAGQYGRWCALWGHLPSAACKETLVAVSSCVQWQTEIVEAPGTGTAAICAPHKRAGWSRRWVHAATPALRGAADTPPSSHGTSRSSVGAGKTPSQSPPLLRPFDLTPADAWERFEGWQRQGGLLAPRSLLGCKSGSALIPELLPFWMFDATFHVQFRGRLWFSDQGPKGTIEVSEVSRWSKPEDHVLSWSDSSMQVYASYDYRRDLADAARGTLSAEDCRPLEEFESAAARVAPSTSLPGSGLRLQPAAMRKSIAWQLAYRNFIERERTWAHQQLAEQHPNANRITDINVLTRVLRRTARLVHLPVYKAVYSYGKQVNAETGENEPQQFETFISGRRDPGCGSTGVSGEAHLSPHRAQAIVAGTAAGAGLGVEAAASPLFGIDPQVFIMDNAYVAAIALAVVNLATKMAGDMAKQKHHKQLQEHEDQEATVLSSLGPMDMAEPYELQALADTEWRRWEEVNKWEWDPVKRQEWAEGLFRRQHRRILEQRAFRARMEEEMERKEQQAAREARRQAKWGRSSHHHHFEHNGHGSQPRGRGRRDFKGYFKLLGLNESYASDLKEDDIKAAFRAAAMEWHPDKQVGSRCRSQL
mmetsp:Transcript_11233/g.31835  ORF Transcript_11233/g.31835 Transcript_11233/m.31835 type:complete len:597 (-) Transcript_11233:689-2479(-)